MVGAVAVLIDGVLSPVVDVDIAQTAHQQLHRDEAGGRGHRQARVIL